MVDKLKAPKWMLSNSKGKKDFIMTLLVIAFLVVSFRVIAGALGGFNIAGKEFVFKEMQATEIAAYLGTLLSAYVVRRNQIGSSKPE